MASPKTQSPLIFAYVVIVMLPLAFGKWDDVVKSVVCLGHDTRSGFCHGAAPNMLHLLGMEFARIEIPGSQGFSETQKGTRAYARRSHKALDGDRTREVCISMNETSMPYGMKGLQGFSLPIPFLDPSNKSHPSMSINQPVSTGNDIVVQRQSRQPSLFLDGDRFERRVPMRPTDPGHILGWMSE